jgi:hypothetical protein
LELGHLPYKKKTFEAYVGAAALRKKGLRKWQKHVSNVIEQFRAAMEPDEILLGAAMERSSINCRAAIGAARMPMRSQAGSHVG